jgi:membrane-associated protease RseP (regulator of RpoE activity)
MNEASALPPAPTSTPAPAPEASKWRTNLALFLATVASVFVTGVVTQGGGLEEAGAAKGFAGAFMVREALVRGGQFTATLLTILVAHELGHYVAARLHKVDASLPYFIPMPLLSPFGTMGAVIRMRGVIPTRRALLDIGASGPIAGLCFAIPLYIWGASHSHLVPLSNGAEGSVQLGESILMKLLDHVFAPPKPEGMDLELSPIAFGAWGGMFVTMINLLPVGQLDGGHVAYALFGERQDRYAQLIHRSMLAFFFVVVFGHVARDLAGGLGLYHLGKHLANSLFWLVWFQVLAILGTLASRGRGDELPPGALTIRTRLAATIGLVVLASVARDNRSPVLPLAFFTGLAILVAMEVKGGVLRRHDLLDHPPTAPAPLDRVRAIVAILTLVMFALLFMPEPFTM